MKRKSILVKTLFIAFILNSIITSAQDCGCTHTLTPGKNTITFDGNLQTPKVKAGDVICITPGDHRRIIIKNIVGTAENPVTIKNCGGRATFSDTGTLAHVILMMYSKHFRFTGTGDPNYLQGIQVKGGSSGMAFAGECTNLEVDHIEIFDCNFAGIMAKTDPSCTDTLSWRENFTMYDVSIHHNYVHDVQGEGFYIGNSFFNGVAPGTSACGGKAPHSINGVDVYRNVVKRTGCEGIQVGSATKNCKIHDNTVDTTGLNPFANFQNNGLQIGNGTGGMLYNNWMNYCPGNGISCLGIGDNLIFNNIIINPGADTAALSMGIFMDEQATDSSLLGKGMKFINNTIINPRGNAIRIYNDRLPMSYILNNLVVQYGANPVYVKKLNNNVKYTELGNIYRNQLADIKFVDPANKDYRLQATSPAVGAGVDASSHGVTFDFNNIIRSGSYDVGAFAYVAPDPIITNISNSFISPIKETTFFVYPNPVYDHNNEIVLNFFLDKTASISIKTYNTLGVYQSEIEAKTYNAGWNEIKVPRTNQANGTMLFTLLENGKPIDSQIVIVK